jgi:hypothetical protein
MPMKKRIIYEGPPSQVVDQYAREVCQQLGQKFDAGYNTPEMSRELAGFLKIVASICTKAMNRDEKLFAAQD